MFRMFSHKLKVLNAHVLLFFVVMFFALLTYVIPVGKFQTEQKSYITPQGATVTKEVVVPHSFSFLEDVSHKRVIKGTPIFNSVGGSAGITNFMFEGLTSGDKSGSAIGVIMFILVIGGSLGIIIRTGAIESGILRVIDKVRGKEIAIIPILFILFSLGGALFGMSEECIAFSAVIVPLVIALGYDGITAVLISYGASQIGYATSPLNPFCTMIAQGIAGVPILSGSHYRWLMWVFFTILGVIFSLLYAKKIKKTPKKSLSYDSDTYFREDFKTSERKHVEFNTGRLLIVVAIFACLAWIVWGVLFAGYFIPQLATIFFILGLFAGVVGVIFKLNNMTISDIAENFVSGSKDLLGAALMIGMAKGIILVLGGDSPTQNTVLNTLLNYSSEFLKTLPPSISAWFMYVFQLLMRFLVVSTSGQAALTMPLLAPLASLIGLTKQMAVLTYQLSNFGGIVFPTDASLIGVLAIARINWVSWAKSQIWLQLLLIAFASIFILVAVYSHY